MGAFFKIYRYWYTDLLIEVKFNIVSEHLPDDSDEFAGAAPQSIVASLPLGSLGVIIFLESRIIFYDIMDSIHNGITQYARALLDIRVFLA